MSGLSKFEHLWMPGSRTDGVGSSSIIPETSGIGSKLILVQSSLVPPPHPQPRWEVELAPLGTAEDAQVPGSSGTHTQDRLPLVPWSG